MLGGGGGGGGRGGADGGSGGGGDDDGSDGSGGGGGGNGGEGGGGEYPPGGAGASGGVSGEGGGGGEGGGSGIGACGSTKVLVAVEFSPPPAGVALYEHVGGAGGGGDGGGGWEGGWQSPSQSTMYSTCTKLPSYAFSSTAGVAVVRKEYVPSTATGNGIFLEHSKKPRPSTTAPSDGLHLPWTSSPLAVVLTMYSSTSS